MAHIKKAVPTNLIKKRSMQTESRPRLSGKVSAKPSEGVSMGRTVRIEYKYEQI